MHPWDAGALIKKRKGFFARLEQLLEDIVIRIGRFVPLVSAVAFDRKVRQRLRSEYRRGSVKARLGSQLTSNSIYK